MAKGSNNLSGRRSSSRNAKPYDANNSFVKKVATKVTDFIPQRSWISKWFNTSQSDGDVLDETENPEEIESEEDIQKPPPLKRPCIRMDVIHPPGTFTIQPRTKALINTASPTKQQFSIHNETSQDFSEPPMAGPSGMSCLISSTPSQEDINNITPQRSELNSLVAATNNGTANGMDDNSESSESTSGCSSLIPQTNRQEAPSNASYSSPFSSRKRFNNDKLNFANHAQSPRSLFLDSNRDSLSSRRPSFNASVMSNTPDRASPLSSPFYSGNITFGGANAAGLYKRGRSLFNSSNEIQLKVPRRTSVEVKPSTAAGVDSSGMSQTAKKILEALEHFSSPITDAKKIPVKMLNNTANKKRTREEETLPKTKVGLRHLTRELTVPTIPDILKLRRRQKLEDTTVAARRIVSARTVPAPPQEYQLRTNADEDTKHQGKVKGKSTNLDQEETVEPVNLPNIPLPISNLPNFNFTPSVDIKAKDKSFLKADDTFTFASPIKVSNTTKNLKSINNFTFSSPISADKQPTDNFSDATSKKISAKLDTPSSSCTPTVTQNFMWSGSSTAPRPKEKAKNEESTIPAASGKLKSGSVMDILLPKSDKTESEKSKDTTVLSKSKDDIKMTNSKPQQDSLFMWECSECLIKNNNSETKCSACKTAKSSFKDSKVSEASSTLSSNNQSKINASDSFGAQFKLSSNQWECTSCFVRNKETETKCCACNSPKPGSKTETKSSTANLSSSGLNKPLEGSWECSNCKIKNSVNSTTCSSCKTSKSHLSKPDSKKDTITDVTNAPTKASTDSNITVKESMDKFKPSKDTWECPCCMVRNVATVDLCPCCNTAKPGAATKNVPLLANGFGDKFKKPEGAWNCDACMLQNKAADTECVACGGLKPGAKKPESSASTSSNLQFSFGIPPSEGGFKFGIDKDNQQKTDSVTTTNGFKFGESQQSSSQSSQFTFGIQKEETKPSETLKPESSMSSTTGSGFGFQINAKSTEKTDVQATSNQVSEIEKKPAPFSFGIPKSESVKAETDKQSASTVSSTTLPSPFTFGVPKSDVKQPEAEKGSVISETTKSKTETVEPATVTNANTVTSATKSSSQETKLPIFLFGVPNTAVGVSSSICTSFATSLPTSTQSCFTFSETKLAQAAPVPSYSQIATTVPAATTSTTFTFGENKPGFAALSSSSSGGSIFSNISSAPSLFGTTDTKTTSAFGAQENKTPAFGAQENKAPAFGAQENKAPAFGAQENKAPAFGAQENKASTFGATASKPSAFSVPENKVAFANPKNKPSIFGSTDAKIPVFGSTETKTAPLFNPTPQAPAATPAPTFNAPAATPNPFGSSVTPVFGSNTSSTFATESKPSIFGSTTKPGETTTPNSNLFTFNATPAQPVAQPVAQPTTGFNFSANTDTPGSNQNSLFTFGSATTTPSSNVFGGTFNSPASSTTGGFTFNAPKPEAPAPAFGQSTVTNPIFGGPQPGSQDQPSSSFSSTSSNTGFNFGAAAPATSTGGFNFGAAPAAVPSTGFNFNPPSSTPTFDPNTSPSFNFTGGNAPPVFSAVPQTMAQRKIKKALRRMR
ncbi:uncharacterized protein LOC143188388 [Calliopsis andreniformis]|uniref:uncharacterized protein LOC143188388 n=1 Tax=Calliopsis andreniformis TaxID=337506 RepID=UPI003FCCCDF5